MIIPKEILKKHTYLEKDSIIVGYRGSIAHGTFIPSSDENSIDDKDIMTVVIHPIEYYFGLEEKYEYENGWSRGTKSVLPAKDNPWDIVTYEFKKFIRLLKEANPNVLGLLWLPQDKYIKLTQIGERLIDSRDMFISKKVYDSFCGYAYAQMKKMENSKFNGYMGKKRKALVEKYNYDPKNAAHLIRLLRMGDEFLNEGTFFVDRTNIDAQELIDIKTGKWSLEKVKEEAGKLFNTIDFSFKKVDLQAEPDFDSINKFCVSCLQDHFNK